VVSIHFLVMFNKHFGTKEFNKYLVIFLSILATVSCFFLLDIVYCIQVCDL
jgi:hypothetical protein